MHNQEENILKPDIPILPIGSVALSLGVHQRTLRIYDKQGILSPERTEKNRRYYSINDVEKAKVILFLTRNLALNLSGVKIILTMLEENKIEPSSYMEYIKKIAKLSMIEPQVQENNLKKAASKGRKPSKK